MLAKVFSSALVGIDAIQVDVEVDIAQGLPQFATVGLPDGAVKESKDRVRSALKNAGYEFPQRKITVNLAPADVKKEGAAFDLPIAVGILAPSFFTSAGARWTVILRWGNSYPAFFSAERTRSLLSFTAPSGNPTVANWGSPWAISTSTSTWMASMPTSALEKTLANIRTPGSGLMAKGQRKIDSL